jgi:hypothetical protein
MGFQSPFREAEQRFLLLFLEKEENHTTSITSESLVPTLYSRLGFEKL